MDQYLFDGNDNVLPRTFEQLITERGAPFEENQSQNYNLGYFNCGLNYHEIKNKLFILNENEENINIDQESRNALELIYKTKENNEILNTLKKKITEIYNKKIQIESVYFHKENLFNQFSKYIHKITDAMVNIAIDTNSQNDDAEFKKMLLEKIEIYYKDLNLENIKKEKLDTIKEFLFLRETIKNLTSTIDSVCCGICYSAGVTHFIDPCGHTVCDRCKDSCDIRPLCPYCRVQKNSFKRLYFN